MLNRLCLCLNATYEPIRILTARRALTMVFCGKAVVEAMSDQAIRTGKLTINLPDVIRLVKYRKVPRQSRSVSRRGLLLRDGYTCQYCGHKSQAGDLTLDHVMPKSRGGQSTWENLVTSCFPCNNRKSNQTPQEAGMPLARAPRQITIHAKHRLMAGDQKVWDKFLFA